MQLKNGIKLIFIKVFRTLLRFMSQSSAQPVTKDFSQFKIVVAGDIMLDRYIYGDVTRVAPEAPVPVVKILREENMLGGAGNVLMNLRGLGVQTSIVAVIGTDEAGERIKTACEKNQIGAAGLIALTDRPTTEKTRFSGNGQILLRADQENASAISGEVEKKILSALKQELQNAHALILSDYLKGALTDKVIRGAIDAAKERNIPVLVDPKSSDFSIYRGADVVTPNLKELAAATKMSLETDENVVQAAEKIFKETGLCALVVTRSERGASVCENNGTIVHIREVAEKAIGVSGAGDTFIATLAGGLAADMTLTQAAELANKACSIVVAQEGTTPIRAEDLFKSGESRPFSDWEAARAQIRHWQDQGLKVGFTNGCFDILHAGHVTYLQQAAQFCDRLVVGLNHDKSVRILKGPTRPVNDESARATVLSALASIDLVVLFGAEEEGTDNTPCDLLRHIRPDVIFKGGDYHEDQLPEARVVRDYGGEVKIMGLVEGKSTTGILNKISHKG